MRRRFAELAGLALGLIGLALLVALATYDPLDPSLNTATARHPTESGRSGRGGRRRFAAPGLRRRGGAAWIGAGGMGLAHRVPSRRGQPGGTYRSHTPRASGPRSGAGRSILDYTVSRFWHGRRWQGRGAQSAERYSQPSWLQGAACSARLERCSCGPSAWRSRRCSPCCRWGSASASGGWLAACFPAHSGSLSRKAGSPPRCLAVSAICWVGRSRQSAVDAPSHQPAARRRNHHLRRSSCAATRRSTHRSPVPPPR